MITQNIKVTLFSISVIICGELFIYNQKIKDNKYLKDTFIKQYPTISFSDLKRQYNTWKCIDEYNFKYVCFQHKLTKSVYIHCYNTQKWEQDDSLQEEFESEFKYVI